MLSRFKKIKNIGRFHDTDASGRNFLEKTVVIGKNGNGKSTLTAILRSAVKNNPKYIKERKTFGHDGDQKVEIIFEESGSNHPLTYSNGAWSGTSPDIEIFDSKFIAENIFDGERLLESHAQNLHRVIVGETGRKMAGKVDDLGGKVRDKNQALQASKQTYDRSTLKQVMTFDEFIALAEDSEIETKINNLRQEKEFAQLADKPLLPSVTTPDFTDYPSTFMHSVGNVHTQAKVKIDEHVKSHWSDEEHSKSFLSEGLKLAKEDKDCPYCGQDTNNVSDLLDAYRTYFDTEYRDWEDRLRRYSKEVQDWNLAAQLEAIERGATEWRKYLESECDIFTEWLSENKEKITSAKQSFEDECAKKNINPEYQFDPSCLEELKEVLKLLFNELEKLNTSIESYKQRVGGKNVSEIESDLQKLVAQKERYQPTWKQFCAEYKTTLQEKNVLATERDQSIEDLKTYSTTMFSSHQAVINNVLASLRADFKLQNFTERSDLRRSGAVFCGFDLVFFDQHEVRTHGSGEDTPDLNNTLSQGDRNLLAFAFFIATLITSQDLDKKIIVIDDPIASFDYERKNATVHLLANLESNDGKRPVQLVLLTHDTGFLKAIYRHNGFAEAKYLHLIPDGIAENGCVMSCLADCDVEEVYLKPRERKDLEVIERTINERRQVPADALLRCRNVLEAAFNAKYYLQLKALPSSSLGGYVDELVEQGVYTDEQRNDFGALLRMMHEPHHTSVGMDEDDSDGDKRFLMEETLRLLREV